jgi:4a-hydroxytetrahydrobiopterin dehydratase
MASKKSKAPSAPSVPQLSDEQIAQALAAHPEWSQAGEAIQRTFAFKTFAESMAFVNKVAHAAEAMNHHPDIMIRYNKVTMTLSTHDAGGISQKDFELAGAMDKFV